MSQTTELPAAIQSINDWLRTDPAFGLSAPEASAPGVVPPPRVDPLGGDFGAGIIRGASVISKGVTKDARGEVDDTTMRQIIDLGNASPGGSKVRFTHPGLSDDGLGSYLGRAKNFRLDGDRPRADIHLSPVSEKSPKGNLRDYVLGLADKDPEAFGVSVAMKWKEEYRRNADGTLAKADGAEDPLPPLIRAERLHAVDVVDNPAANDGLFADAGLADAPARQATAFLDQLFAGLAPEAIRARVGNFLTRYLRHKGAAVSEFSEGDDPMADANTPTTPPATPATSAGPASAAAATTPAAPAVTPAAPATQNPGANAPGSPTAEQFREQVRAEEQAAALKRVKEINALCDKAGFSSLAIGFIEKGNSIDEVRETLFAKMCADRTPVPGDGKTGELNNKPADPDAAYRAEYQALDKKSRFGVTEEQYIRTCKIDAGELELAVGSEAKK